VAGTVPIHRRLAEIGLRVGGPFGFALAGGHAIAAHGILERPSEDVVMRSVKLSRPELCHSETGLWLAGLLPWTRQTA
jgi:hypothetical protein